MNETEQTYRVATYSYTCTAYVRTTLRIALGSQGVWAGTEYVNAAREMTGLETWATILPDETTWSLTKLQLMTIRRALEWRKGQHLSVDHGEFHLTDAIGRLKIADEIYRVLQGIWHSEGKYWM